MPDPTDDLTTASDEIVQSLQWQLTQLRSEYLKGSGFAARRKVAAARGRVFTLLSGVKDADVTVVARLVEIAQGAAHPDPPSPDLDAGLADAIDSWRSMELADYWDTVTKYVQTTQAGVAEQVLLLTYLLLVVGSGPPGDEPASTSVDLLAGVNAAWLGDQPDQIFTGCGRLTRYGADATLAFSTQVALLILAAFTVPSS